MVTQYSQQISDRRIRTLCENGQVKGAIKIVKTWKIYAIAKNQKKRHPKDAILIGGECEIRTHAGFNPQTVFKTASL